MIPKCNVLNFERHQVNPARHVDDENVIYLFNIELLEKMNIKINNIG